MHCFTCRGLSYRPCADRHPCPVLGLYLYHCLDHREALSPQLGGLCYLASASESPPFPKVHNSMLTLILPFPPFCYHHPISLWEEKDRFNSLQEFNPVSTHFLWSRAGWSIVLLFRSRCARVLFSRLLKDGRPKSSSRHLFPFLSIFSLTWFSSFILSSIVISLTTVFPLVRFSVYSSSLSWDFLGLMYTIRHCPSDSFEEEELYFL